MKVRGDENPHWKRTKCRETGHGQTLAVLAAVGSRRLSVSPWRVPGQRRVRFEMRAECAWSASGCRAAIASAPEAPVVRGVPSLTEPAPPRVGRSPHECGAPAAPRTVHDAVAVGPALRDVVRREVTGQGQDHQAEHGHHRHRRHDRARLPGPDRPSAAAGPADTSTKAVPMRTSAAQDTGSPGRRDLVGNPRHVHTPRDQRRRPRPAAGSPSATSAASAPRG